MTDYDIWVADIEVFAYDYLAVFKSIATGEYEIFHNDPVGIRQMLSDRSKIFGFFNGKNYDQWCLKAICNDGRTEVVKEINDFIISGNKGWEYPDKDLMYFFFNQFDLMDDMQVGLSLKSIEAHLGMDIKESQVDFNIDRPLTPDEVEETIIYCKHDVDTTEKLFHLRKNYLENKIALGRTKGIDDSMSMYMTNAKLTAGYLGAMKRKYDDEREYVYPTNLLKEYIPQEVFDFFDKLKDKSIPDDEVFSSKLEMAIGDCDVTVAYGGIHGAIPTYREKSTNTRIIRNQDVASYYPHLMVIDGYCSRSIPNPETYSNMLETRMKAKKSGDMVTANALKLVANTTYGATLNQYNDLCDPLMARSVCITGQLRLLELANHLVAECKTLKIIQLNTDGIMVSLDKVDEPKYKEICEEWQQRTRFELEEDCINEIIQKDVNNYIEIAEGGKIKTKGAVLVRGISKAGAFNINNNTTIVSKAILDYFVNNISIEKTINECDDILEFQLVAKTSSKYSETYHIVDGERIPVQRCNRVYATSDKKYGTLLKIHKERGNDVKISGLPTHCLIDNSNQLDINSIDKTWYVKLAQKQINDFLGIKPPKVNKRKINALKKQILKILED